MNIEELYKRNFEDEQMSVDTGLWQDISDKLASAHKDMPVKKGIKTAKISIPVKYVLVSLSFITVAALLYLFWPKDKNIVIDNIEKQTNETLQPSKKQTYPAYHMNETTVDKPVAQKNDKDIQFTEFEITDSDDILPQINSQTFNVKTNKSEYESPALVIGYKETDSSNQESDSEKKSTDEVKKTEKMLFKPDIFCPNLITPNGDGINDCLIIGNIEKYPDNSIIIYDRQGKTVYQKYHYENDFCAENLESGAYIYTLTLRFNGKTMTYNFSLSVIR